MLTFVFEMVLLDSSEFVSLPHFSNGRVWSGLSPSNIIILREQLAPAQHSQWHLGSPRPCHRGLLSCAHGESEGIVNYKAYNYKAVLGNRHLPMGPGSGGCRQLMLLFQASGFRVKP